MTPLSPKQKKIAITIGSLLCAYVLVVGAYQWSYRSTVLPGVRLEGADLGGQTKQAFLQNAATVKAGASTQAQSIALKHPSETNTATVSLKNAYVLNGETLWKTAYAKGRSFSEGWAYAPFLLRAVSPSLSASEALQVDEARLAANVEQAVKDANWNRLQKDASFAFAPSGETSSTALTVSVLPSQAGESVNLEKSIKRITDALRAKQTIATVVLSDKTSPRFDAEDLQPLVPVVQQWVSGPLTLVEKTSKSTFSAPAATIAQWIELSPSSTTAEARLSPERLEAYFATQAATRLQAPTNGTLDVDQDNKLVGFVAPTKGQSINLAQTIQEMQNALGGDRKADLTVETTYGRFEGEAAERLGIKEFMGIGHSAFPGSPSNRRKNIALGAKKVDSTLIAPNTEFSLLTALGEIDGSHGWLPELVIKGNITTPEFGGGLCQIGTTIFRTALNVGLPITQRQNHSYRVSYYEPAGTDATIYDPAPDFRFKNDTANWILVTQELKGDDVSFVMWGTKDGRVASSTYPVLSNIIAPPPKKIIETTSIPVGTTKCTETAHAGATAMFDYAVTYAGGDTKKTTFKSIYRPWQAVCLVGVAALSTPAVPTGVDETGLNNPG